MENSSGLKQLGELVRAARKRRKMSLEDVADLAGIKPSYLWIIEKAYSGAKRRPTVPSDTVLDNLAKALDVPLPDFHTALGRIPANTASTTLVREKLAEQGISEAALTADQMDGLIREIEAITVFRIQRMMDEAEKERGKKRRFAEQESQMDERFVDEERLVSRAGRN